MPSRSRSSVTACTRSPKRYAEGLCMPAVPLVQHGRPGRSMMEMVLSNVRGREEREGDILAQGASNATAAARLREICDRFGTDAVLACFHRFHDESERMMRD